jgi:hypothetical protein
VVYGTEADPIRRLGRNGQIQALGRNPSAQPFMVTDAVLKAYPIRLREALGQFADRPHRAFFRKMRLLHHQRDPIARFQSPGILHARQEGCESTVRLDQFQPFFFYRALLQGAADEQRMAAVGACSAAACEQQAQRTSADP